MMLIFEHASQNNEFMGKVCKGKGHLIKFYQGSHDMMLGQYNEVKTSWGMCVNRFPCRWEKRFSLAMNVLCISSEII